MRTLTNLKLLSLRGCGAAVAISSIILLVATNAYSQTPARYERVDMNKKAEVVRKGILEKGPYFSLSGKLERINSKVYLVNRNKFHITKKTRIQGKLITGAIVKVRGSIVDGKKIAKAVVVGSAMKLSPHTADSTAEAISDVSGPKDSMIKR